ncbi:MAG: CRTAC1 family protein [Rhodothermales bacterium]
MWQGLIGLVLASLFWGCGADGSSSEDAAAEAQLAFTDITAEGGLGDFVHRTGAYGRLLLPETMGAGVTIFDYDGDADQDVLLVGGGMWTGRDSLAVPALRLYQNDGTARFTDITESAGLADLRAYGFGATAADYDNDDDPDLYLTTLYRNLLLRNDGGRYTEVAEQAGVAGEPDAWSATSIFFDADRDGWLDLYVGNYVDWTPETDIWCSLDGTNKTYCTPIQYRGLPSRFYRNNGDGTFTDRTAEAGFEPTPGKTLGVAQLDYNADGWPDLIVANDTERDLLFENNGDGTFTERGLSAGLAFDEKGLARAGMGIDVGDLENDGRPTYLVGSFAQEMNGVFRYVGNGLFIDRAATSRIGRPSLPMVTFGLFLFDVDYDLDLDLLAANGHVFPEVSTVYVNNTYRQPTQLFLNDGSGTFADATDQHAVLQQPILGRGAAYGDLDGDGDLDVIVTENGGSVHVWRNDSTAGNYLRVHLTGTASNRDALGADLIAVVGETRMHRQVRTGSSYMSQSELTASFGLGTRTVVDSLYVVWPSGRDTVLTQIQANQELRLTER